MGRPNSYRSSVSVHRGFTFVEILAAMLFMAIVIPVTVEGLLIANRAGIVAERKRVASELAERQLSYLILSEEWENGRQQANFGEAWPGYRWQLDVQDWGLENITQTTEETIYLVTLNEYYMAQEKEYSVSLSTLMKEVPEEKAEEPNEEELSL